MRIVFPPGLDPACDGHGRRIAAELGPPGDVVALPEDLTFVFIVFSNRSGSTYLAELLASTGFFNRSFEPLNADAVIPGARARKLGSYAAYFAAIVVEGAHNAHFVVKASVGQLAVLAAHGILDRILPRARFIQTERMDKVAQVVSWSIAVQTGRFTSYQPEPERATPQYDGAELRRSLEGLVNLHARTALFFALNGIVPFHVTYEALAAHPRETTERVCTWLGHPELRCDPTQVGLQRQWTARNAEWCRRFVEEQRAAAG
jgi:LPS sulfotransferase NodH